MLFGGAPSDEAKKTKFEDSLQFLEKFLEGQTWAAGSSMTIADLSLVASISTFEVAGFDMSKYPNISRLLRT